MKDLNYYLNLHYEIRVKRLTEDEGGGWFAQIPLLPGCMADGETAAEAITNLGNAKIGWIETCWELGRLVPEPGDDGYSGQLRLRMPKSLHRELTDLAKAEKVSLNQYINYQLAKGIGRVAAKPISCEPGDNLPTPRRTNSSTQRRHVPSKGSLRPSN